jgi:hypothetical protein
LLSSMPGRRIRIFVECCKSITDECQNRVFLAYFWQKPSVNYNDHSAAALEAGVIEARPAPLSHSGAPWERSADAWT